MNGAPWVLGLAGLAALAGATRRGSANKAAPAAVVAEAKRDAVAFRAEVARWLKGTTAQQREDFELNWREPEIRRLFGARVLGYGNFRLALSSTDPRFVIKLAMRPSDNLDEAGAWEDAGPRTKAMLVPVVAHDPEGHWLVMERVTPYPWDEVESDDLRSLRQRAGKVGLRDVHPDNVSTDLRLLDYAEPVSLKGSPARQGSSAPIVSSERRAQFMALARDLDALVRRCHKEKRGPKGKQILALGALHGASYLGSGATRTVFGVPEGALKIERAPRRHGDNRREVTVWTDAPARIKQHLVPVLDHDKGYAWLLMPKVKTGGSLTYHVKEILEGCGLGDFEYSAANVSKDGRLLDYAFLESPSRYRRCLEEGRKQRAMQGSRATFTTGYCLAFAKVLKKRLGREAKLYDVVEPDAPGSAYMFSGTPHHAVVAWHGLFLDADGAFTEGELLARWNERAPRQVRRPLRLEPHHAGRAKDVNLKSACPLHLMASAEAVAAKVETQARRRVEQKGSHAKLKPPTLRDLGLPTVWFHGTKASFTGKLKPNKGMGGACVWLADEAGARAYAGQGPTARLVRVELDPSTRVADLADARDPIVRDFIRRDRSASNLRWHNREEVTDEEMAEAIASWQRRTTHYDAIESRGWAKDFFRKAGVDALLVRDVQGWGGHQSMPSLCVLNRAKIAQERDATAR